MRRRAFVWQGLAASAAVLGGAIGPSWGQSASAPVDVIVIGAGLAGLACARRLIAAGRTVRILEARQRIGGRIWSNPQLGYPVDLGASWLHGISNNPLYPVVTRDLGLRTQITNYDDMVTIGPDGLPWDKRRTDRAGAWLDGFVRQAERSGSPSESLSRLLPVRLKPDQSFVLITDVVHEVGAEPKMIAANAPQGDGKDLRGPDVMVPAGLESLVRSVATGLDIRLGEEVRTIRNSAEGVTLTTARGTVHQARAVCCTLPLGVLKKGAIRFDPPLPAPKTLAIKRLGVGLLDKIVLQFPFSFWDNRQLIRNDGPTAGLWSEWYNLAPMLGRPVLMGFNAADRAREVAGLPDAAIVASALSALKRCYPSRTIPAPTGSLITRWGQDPFALGSYSYQAVDSTPSMRRELARPWLSVVFAGEATSVSFPATLQGAYLSGEEAAKSLLDLKTKAS